MSYDMQLANKVRAYLAEVPDIAIEEKEMFGTLNFMVNGKTCVCVRGQDLMLRYDPQLQATLAAHRGYAIMLLKGKEYLGYCYIQPEGYAHKKDFEYLMGLCLAYNRTAKKSRKKTKR